MRNPKVNTKAVILLIALAGIFSAQAQSVVDTYGRLQVTGNKVTSETGQEISLAGMSLFWSNAAYSLSDFYKPEVVNHLADNWDASIIRAAVGVKELWDDGRGYKGTKSFFIDGREYASGKEYTLERTEAVINAAIDKGIYIIVDWHTHKVDDNKQEAIEFFTYIADKYGDNDHVIYEIFNEPIEQSWDEIKDYSRDVISAIRSKDADNLIIVGSSTWSQDVDKPANDQNWTSDPNIAYTLHFYANTHKQGLRNKAKNAMDAGIALFVTEWGSVDASGNGGYNPSETNSWINFLKENKISHVNWSLSDVNESASVVTFKADPSNMNNSDGKGVQRFINNDLTTPGNFVKDIVLDQAVNTTLSTENFKLNGETYTVTPVPAKNSITINSKNSIDSISITDIMGRTVLSKKLNQQNPTINLDKLSTGNYILQVSYKGSVATSKIVISQ